MRRTFSKFGLVMASGLMLAACSSSSESTTTSEAQTTAAVETIAPAGTTVADTAEAQSSVADTTEATTEEAVETTTQEPETETQMSVEDYPAINKNANVGSGYITFVADNKNYYFDTVDNKTYEIPGYIIGGRVAMDNNSLVNVVTGETIATNVDNTFYGYASWGKGDARNIIQVVTKEESFSGDTYKIGALDSLTGEWLSPLKEYEGVVPAEYSFRPNGGVGSIVTFDCHVKLNLLNGKAVIGDNTILAGTNVKVLCEDVSDSFDYKLYMYNALSDETVLLDNANTYTDLSYSYGLQKGLMLRRIDNNSAVSYVLFDDDLNQIDIDLSKYDIKNFYGINDSFIVFTAYNPNGEGYLIVLDRAGNEAMEPVKEPSNIALINSGLVYSDYVNTTYLDNDGNMTEAASDDVFFSDLDLSTGFTVRKVNGKYYFVNVTDPENLIHPLAYLDK